MSSSTFLNFLTLPFLTSSKASFNIPSPFLDKVTASALLIKSFVNWNPDKMGILIERKVVNVLLLHRRGQVNSEQGSRPSKFGLF